MEVDCKKGVMNGPLKFLTARKILPLLDLLAKFKRVLACSCFPNFCVARQLAKQIFNFCSCSQKNRSVRHARECSQRPFVIPSLHCFAVKVQVIVIELPVLIISSCLYLFRVELLRNDSIKRPLFNKHCLSNVKVFSSR